MCLKLHLLFWFLTSVYSDEILIPSKPDPAPQKGVRDVLTRGSVRPGSENDPLKNCPVTSQFRLSTSSGSSQMRWMLQALDINGKEKKMGGDELYITFQQDMSNKHPIAVAIINDYRDGRYGLDFSSTPMNPELFEQMDPTRGGNLILYYTYTCDMADIPPPLKKDWPHGGLVDTIYHVNVPRPPPIKTFQPPSLPKNVKPFDHVVGVGDSLMMQFSGAWYEVEQYFRSNGSYTDRFGAPLNSDTLESYIGKIKSDIKETQKKLPKGESSSLLVLLGSGVWDILEDEQKYRLQGKSFNDHAHVVAALLKKVTEDYKNNDNIQFAWKSITATHAHTSRVKTAGSWKLHRTKYGCYTRSKRLYNIQKKVAKIYNIPFLDIYEASFLSSTYHRDTSHYLPDLTQRMWNWFFPESDSLATK